MEKLHFEFNVTPFIDWRESQTIYVKAVCAKDAEEYMDRLTDPDDTSKPYADYKYLCYVPENCLWNNCDILDVDDEVQYVLEISEKTDHGLPWLKWYQCRMNGKMVAIIAKNEIADKLWHIAAYDDFQNDHYRVNFEYTGGYDTLDEAKDRVDDFCKYLVSRGN